MTRGKIRPMTDTAAFAPPTNREVAALLEMSESGVSRLRSGDRMPSLAMMQKIERAYGWTVQAQSEHRQHEPQTWTGAFEDAIVLHQAETRMQVSEGLVGPTEGGGAA